MPRQPDPDAKAAKRFAQPTQDRPILALDTASPRVSVAIGVGATVFAERSVELRSSSQRLIAMIDEVLRECALELRALSGVVALRGPGSFTGLRVGLATVLGFHQALALPATAIPTHYALAAWARAQNPELQRCTAVIDALRGDWFAQTFLWQVPARSPRTGGVLARPAELEAAKLEAEGPARCRPGSELLATTAPLVGFGISGWVESVGATARCLEPAGLAATTVELASDPSYPWDVATLTAPLYLREPAVRLGG